MENYYDVQAYLNSLATELDEENRARLDLINRATSYQDNYLYRKEANQVDFDRLDQIKKLASKKVAADGELHRMPKQLPPRYDLRRYNETPRSPQKSPSNGTSSFFREAAFSDLPQLVQAAVKKSLVNAGAVDSVLLSEESSGSFKVSEKDGQGRKVLKKSLKFDSDHQAYSDLRSAYALATITEIKVALLDRLDQLERLKKQASIISVPAPRTFDMRKVANRRAWSQAVRVSAGVGDLLLPDGRPNYEVLVANYLECLKGR